jgi:hypothetical protein
MDNMQDVLAFVAIVLLIAGGGLASIVNFMFSVGVLLDGGQLRAKGRETKFVSPAVWGLAVLIGSFVALALYWLIHHSSLRETTPKAGEGQ